MNNLPPELEETVLSHCNAQDFIALISTNKCWSKWATGIKTKSGTLRRQVFENTELSPPQDCAICYTCNRILRRQKFADHELGLERGDTSRALGGPLANQRFCLDCGRQSGYYQVGKKVKWQHINQFACRTCRTFCGTYDSDCVPEMFPLTVRAWMSGEEKRELRGYKDWAEKQGIIVRARKVTALRDKARGSGLTRLFRAF
ncbi:MAG: hypothetical protein Q9208_008061 [Pyrenodesmia sp. 3 TL-2023]